jgi:serine/threonine protein kinase
MINNQPILTKVAEEFASVRKLQDLGYVGKGTFKETYRIKDTDGLLKALKISDPEKCDSARTNREIEILLRCDSPLICKLYERGTFQSKNNGGKTYYYLIEEFLDGGTLTDQIKAKKLSPEIIRHYAVTLVQAIAYLKSNNIVHRDIKPDNIMFRSTAEYPILVDLGIARDLLDTSLTPSWAFRGPGTPYFASPEQLNNEKHLIDWRSDQFSLGVVLGVCLTGDHPHRKTGMNPQDVVKSVSLREECSSDFKKRVAELGFKNIPQMLAPWPIRRYQDPAVLINSFES